jgi:hypothetical protein
MSAFWDSVIRPLLVALAARVVVEVGVARGETTRKLLEWGAAHGCVTHGIDPTARPRLQLAELEAQYGDAFQFHQATSRDALPRIRDADVVLIDGDHNWYSVHSELEILATVAVSEQRPLPLTLLHDVDWPYGRRDMYFDPEAIPDEYRQEWAKGGLLIGVQELNPDRGHGLALKHAVTEGNPRNGIRTAVEDFLSETDLRINWCSVPGFFGMGILADEALLERSPAVRAQIDELQSPAFLQEQCRRIEENRIGMLIELDTMRRELAALRDAG